ncbi:hypothetical protein ACMYYO_09775 [Dermacoccaceae bacterium W4C1]
MDAATRSIVGLIGLALSAALLLLLLGSAGQSPPRPARSVSGTWR